MRDATARRARLGLCVVLAGAGFVAALIVQPAAGATATRFAVTAVGGGPIGRQTAGRPFSVEVTAEDAGGNVVSDFSGSVELTSTRHCSAGCSTPVSRFSNGSATATITLTAAGWATVTATLDGGSETGTSSGFKVRPGAASTLAFHSTSTRPLASGATRTLTVRIRDDYGNWVKDGTYPVLFQKADGLGGVTGYGSSDSANGVASLTVTGTWAGPLRLQASASFEAGVKTFAWTSFKVVHGPLAQLVFWSPPSKPRPTKSIHVGWSKRLRIKLEDAQGNFVRNKPTAVTFSQLSGDGSASGLPKTVTSTRGYASVVVRGTSVGKVTIQASGGGVDASVTFSVRPSA